MPKIKVLTQYKENNGPANPQWEYKGIAEFTVEYPQKWWICQHEEITEAIFITLKKRNNSSVEYTYISHEYEYISNEATTQTVKLNDSEFAKIIETIIKSK